jgi:hypothetical protein
MEYDVFRLMLSQKVNKSAPPLMEPHSSLPYSQQLSSGLYPEQHESAPKPRIQISIYT